MPNRKAVDELNLTKKIISCHLSTLPLARSCGSVRKRDFHKLASALPVTGHSPPSKLARHALTRSLQGHSGYLPRATFSGLPFKLYRYRQDSPPVGKTSRHSPPPIGD